ncbi:MAG: hypothetical protein GY917_12800, partial [Planctomycetaceae bacterium]|nr:hypothetical protein [Planctomycetaceae bacterium]
MRVITWCLGLVCGLSVSLPVGDLVAADQAPVRRVPAIADGLLVSEKLPGQGAWIDPAFAIRFRQAKRVRATIWFEDQLLGDGQAYRRRAREFSQWKRGRLRVAARKTLQAIHARSWQVARGRIDQLVKEGKISQVEPHWIVNGFSCLVVQETLKSLQTVPGVRKIFASPRRPANRL